MLMISIFILVTLADFNTDWAATVTRAARMPMMAITTSNSTSVNPWRKADDGT